MVLQYPLVIKGGTVVSPNSSAVIDVAIADGLVVALGPDLEGVQQFDAKGLLVVPGAIDSHVHLEMPIGAYTSTDDFNHGTLAALCGGTTTIVDFVEASASQSLVAAYEQRQALARRQSRTDFGLHMTLGPGDLSKLNELEELVRRGCTSFKLYMAYGLALSDGQLLTAIKAIQSAGGLPVVHAENWDVIQTLNEAHVAAGHRSPAWHRRGRPPVLEAEAVNTVATIAEYLGASVHIFHVSCGEAAQVIASARERGVQITGETCPQYLFLDDRALAGPAEEAALAICSPPLRPQEQQSSLWRALDTGALHTIASDHCPFTRAEKTADLSAFTAIPGGVPSIEMRFSSIYSGGVATGRITANQWVDMCCTRPASLLGLGNKGLIEPGRDADVVLFDPRKETLLSPATLHETCGWTPYEGMTMRGWPKTVLQRGRLAVEDGVVRAAPGDGRFLSK
jgi:dihydropyrimidinase